MKMPRVSPVFGLAIALMLLFAGCVEPKAPPQPTNVSNGTQQIMCPTLYSPVCGADNKTYSNSCIALAANVSVAYSGACLAPSACSDTDSGKDVMAAGTVSDGTVRLMDYCFDNATAVEYFCLGGKMANETIACPSGYACSAGACVQKAAEAPACEDSDNGTDSKVAGSVSYGGSTYADSCTTMTQVKEYYCQNGRVASTGFMCPDGSECHNGSCMDMPQVCTDDDGGKNLSKKGTATAKKGSTTVDRQWESCANGTYVKEYYCKANGSIGYDYVYCGDSADCYDAVCVSRICLESDNGDNVMQRGTVQVGSAIYTDYCLSDYNVMEYICAGSSYPNSYYYRMAACPGGYLCTDGACKP